MSKIEIVVHPYAYELLQSRTDQAAITGQPLIERPFWFRNTETGQLYYNLFGCAGWPTEISETSNGLPGYVGIIGVVKPKEEGKPIQDAAFQLLAEGESKDVTSLLDMIITMRKEYGFGLHPDLLQAWFGDPERHVTTIALFNERLIAKGGERAAILIIPPNDFYVQHSFDHYMRSLRSVMVPERRRLFFGGYDVLRKHLRGFKLDNPAVFAVGGLIHTLLGHCAWADSNSEAAFVIEDEGF